MNRFLRMQVESLHRATEERMCPPDAVLRRGGAVVDEHVAECARCQKRIADGLPAGGPGLCTMRTPVRPGDVRRIDAAHAGNTLCENAWRNPPVVLVLSVDGDGTAEVAQVHAWTALADTGDVQLSGIPGAYAEAWNTWRVACGMLNRALFRATDREMDRVRAAKDEERTSDGTPIDAFRKMELVIGRFYADLVNKQDAFTRLLSGRRAVLDFVRREAPVVMAAADTEEPSKDNALAALVGAGNAFMVRAAVLSRTETGDVAPQWVPAEISVCDWKGIAEIDWTEDEPLQVVCSVGESEASVEGIEILDGRMTIDLSLPEGEEVTAKTLQLTVFRRP